MGSWLDLWLALFNILTRSQSTSSRGRHLLACSQFHSSSFKNIAWWYYEKQMEFFYSSVSHCNMVNLCKGAVYIEIEGIELRIWPAKHLHMFLLKLTYFSLHSYCDFWWWIFLHKMASPSWKSKRTSCFDGLRPNHNITMEVYRSSWPVICFDAWQHFHLWKVCSAFWQPEQWLSYCEVLLAKTCIEMNQGHIQWNPIINPYKTGSVFLNIILFSDAVHHTRNIAMWNWSHTINIFQHCGC